MQTYATARVTFHTAYLDDDIYERLKTIPGVRPWDPSRRSWTAPYTGAFVAAQMLDRAGVAYRTTMPDILPLTDFNDAAAVAALLAKVKDAALAAGVKPWVFADWIKDFQMRCAAFAIDRRRSTIWAEPGAGKTIIAILVASVLGLPVVVITKDAVTLQFAREWKRFTGWDVLARRPPSKMRKTDRTLDEYLRKWGRDAGGLAAVLAKAAGRDVPRPTHPPVVVFGWSMLLDWHAEVAEAMKAVGPFFVIFDESQHAKSSKRKKWSVGEDDKLSSATIENMTSAAAALSVVASCVLCTTATPVANVMADLWGQITLVEPDAWGETAKRWLVRYCNATAGRFGGLDVRGINEAMIPELHARLSWSTMMIPYAVSHGQLPKKRRMLVRVAVEDQIAEVAGMGKEVRRAQRAADGSHDDEVVGLARRMRLMAAASRKRPTVVSDILERLQTGKGKVIIFTGWHKDCEDLGARFTKAREDLKVWVSHGGEHDRDDRMEIMDEYQAHPGPCVLVGTWQAWGEGLNLDDTDIIAFAMLPDTPREVAQGEGRGDRLSMNRSLLFLYYVAEGTVDESSIDRLLGKVEQTALVGAGGGRLEAFDSLRDTLVGAADLDATTQRLIGLVGQEDEGHDSLDDGWD